MKFASPILAVLSAALVAAPTFFTSPTATAQDEQSPTSQRFPEIPKSRDYLPTDSKLNRAEDATLAEMRAKFAAPGVDFATAPLWVWNDLLTEEQIRSTLQDFARQEVNQAFVHPRPGLATPYLSDDWFALWNAALNEARKLGMKIWIYDENSYPSGFAGGFVPDAFPESRGSGLDVGLYDSLVDEKGAWAAGENVLYVFEELAGGGSVDRTKEILGAKVAGSPIPPKSADGVRWVVSSLRYAEPSKWHGGKTYVNLLKNGVLDAFLNVTLEEYRKRLGDEFGGLIPGSFTDEPHIAPAGTFSWTDDFPEEFEKRRGYSLLPKLSALVAPIGNDWKKTRYDYYKTALEVYVDRWHRPYGAYCERNGLEYTGHDFEHEWPNAHRGPDHMATAFWRQRPTVDLLMNNFSRGTHSQFGNVRSVRELGSVVRQSGRSRALSENYGAGGYDLRFEDMKRLGDWSYALGVNATDEHLSYITIRGARKHDHPQTFSYHSAWFEQYSKMERYWTRLSYLLSRGELSDERFLLLEPTTTAWFYQQNAGAESGKLGAIGNGFADLLNRLEAAQVDYDLGSEDVIGRIGSVAVVDGAAIYRVGAADYPVVVLPPQLENVDQKTFELLADFAEKGGRVVSLGAKFERVAGNAADQMAPTQKAAFEKLTQKIETPEFDEFVEASRAAEPVAVVANSNADNVFHMTRQTSDSRIVFLCNVDMNAAASVELELKGAWKDAGIEVFDPQTGETRAANGTDFTLAPCGSLALVVSNLIEKSSASEVLSPTTLTLSDFADRVRAKPIDDNALVLDYLTVRSGGETLENEYFYRANAWLWGKNGFSSSPWDNGVQFQDELLRRQFADDSGFEIEYRFVKSDAPISDLRFVAENPGDFKVYCNGTAVDRIDGAWKFDRSFGVYDISKLVQPGENKIRLVAEKMTIFCELAPAWIVGSFSLEPREVGFEIVADKGLAFRLNSDDAQAREVRASAERDNVSWLSSGVDYGEGRRDLAPRLSFAFSAERQIDAIQVWNYCEAGLSKRGIKRFTIPGIGEFELKIGDGSAQIVEFAKPIRLAKNSPLDFVVDENWNGISFPLPENFVGTTAPDVDNAFVGLAEIQFLTRDKNGTYVPINERPTVVASSELCFRDHHRPASCAVDGSGLEIPRRGWASQGRPFYSGAVDYSLTLKRLELPTDRPILFELPGLRERWNGAVAAILVDGNQVASIAFPDEKADLTDAVDDALQSKETFDLTVRVYGTPKNLFGPHHAGKLRGSAWPGSFHGAPARQPSGREYDAIEYGLFAE